MRCNVLGTLRRTLVVLLGVLAFLALSAATASADVSFNVQGKWTCNNRGKVIPIAGARGADGGSLLVRLGRRTTDPRQIGANEGPSAVEPTPSRPKSPARARGS